VTFAPCFLWIFLGAPFIERLRGHVALGAALSAITAAVVGVILNLAGFFAYHVFWPRGFGLQIDWIALAIGVAAFVAMYRFKAGVIKTIATCGALGIAVRLLA
jgi:chromate transporter